MLLNFINQKKLIKIFIIFIIFLFSFFILASGVMADQTGAEKALEGLDTTAEEGFGTDAKTLEGGGVASIVGRIVGAVLAFVGLLFLILLIYGGFIWMTAGGNEEKLKKAISLITQSVIGLIIISAAYLIASFIGETVTLPFTQG